ncbi:glutamate/gamma-aminobutyrate family transporter YjeM [Laedolimicola sp.]|uniref:glutamate/gamma-aminobutyrate family transporter YjeM n=1 Tax=Laedolimicola sp. TaxID=2981663 RepID=UPI003F7D799F
MEQKGNEKNITVIGMVAMIFTTIFGFSNIHTAYFMMGYSAIPWYILAGLAFFIPYALMVAEYGMAFRNEKGGIFAWMSRSVSTKYGFMGIFMWYTAFIIYFVNVSTAFFLKVSAFIWGEDRTSTWSILGLSSTQTVGILSILLILLIALLASRGVRNVTWMAKIGGTAVLVLQLSVIVGAVVILIANKGQLAQPVNFQAFTKSPNAGYTSMIAMVSFATMAVGAYGGIEATGGLVDKAESSSGIPKAIMGAAVAITVCYAILIFCVGSFTNWSEALGGDTVNLANVQYVIMYNLGAKLAESLGAAGAAAAAGAWFTRFYGLAVALATLGSITVFFYGPLTQLIEGTPKEIWPAWLVKKDEKTDVPVHAMWVQSAIICLFLLLISFGGTSVNSFWNLILLMTNVAMTIPYIFVAAAFPFFRKNKSIEKPVKLIRSDAVATALTILVVCVVGFANVFTIINPAMDGDVTSTLIQIAGPVIFALIGYVLYRKYMKKQQQK